MSLNRLYVLVRKDLSPSYRAVQAGHAVAEWLLHDQKSWKNEVLVYLGVRDEDELKQWSGKLELRGIKNITFKEPDINNQITALATNNGELFHDLKLL